MRPLLPFVMWLSWACFANVIVAVVGGLRPPLFRFFYPSSQRTWKRRKSREK
ncbi:hypothetical protein BX661DRAFT_176741 [Kickxella alabastrina]|uniref:uncharacterized protein n=1 Tax=Kickxella alabastrina TaxID=61397 RepID=UPI00221E9C0F|nr:uncharacterized protein BX661DRAFT_176741 [Kickxella alabastrina]KAI7834169.1 hypothetical protein BX661DRAFT_176741 [Kickxella alabastrina]